MTTHTIQLAIKASPEAIWAALTDPATSPAYYFGFEAHFDLAPGARYSYLAGGQEVITGTLIDVVDAERLGMTFRGTWAPDVADLPETTVVYQLGPTTMALPGVTELTLVHEGMPDSDAARNVARGWVLILSGLKTLLETGAPLVTPPAA